MQAKTSPYLNSSSARKNRAMRTVFSAAVLIGNVCAAQAGTLGVYTSDEKGFDTHTFYYDDGKEVVVFDTQFVPALTEKMVKQIHRQTRSPITKVIVTHPNPDKFNGLAYLHGLGATSVSSRAVADAIPAVHAYKTKFWVETMQAFKLQDYPRLENVKEPFDGASKTLRLQSGETLTLFALRNPGVAAHQLVARIDSTGDLIVGDLVHHKAHAWLEGGLVNGQTSPSIEGWIAALDELEPLSTGHPQAKVYSGRGDFVLVADAVREQKDYLRNAARITQSYMGEPGVCRKELSSSAEASANHAVLEQRLTNAYPAYRLPYMVRYSIYGLADAIARQACANPSKVRAAPL
jgi:glyoxylase-like metal-dependent hydrolase (beta-lactamase superfamily II)